MTVIPHSDATKHQASAPLIWLHHWSDTLFSFRLGRPDHFQFVAGQFARLGIPDETGEIIWRAYSIVSPVDAPYLEFFSVLLPLGQFTPRLNQLTLGDQVLVDRKAQGFFTLDRFDNGMDGNSKQLWMIASGTGLSAFLPMIVEPGCWKRFDKVVLVHAVRYKRDLAYATEIKAIAMAITQSTDEKQLSYIPMVSREDNGGAMTGRVTANFANGDLERAASTPMNDSATRVMLCGNPQMVEEMRGLLKARGLRMNRKLEPGHIVVENYW